MAAVEIFTCQQCSQLTLSCPYQLLCQNHKRRCCPDYRNIDTECKMCNKDIIVLTCNITIKNRATCIIIKYNLFKTNQNYSYYSAPRQCQGLASGQ